MFSVKPWRKVSRSQDVETAAKWATMARAWATEYSRAPRARMSSGVSPVQGVMSMAAWGEVAGGIDQAAIGQEGTLAASQRAMRPSSIIQYSRPFPRMARPVSGSCQWTTQITPKRLPLSARSTLWQ